MTCSCQNKEHLYIYMYIYIRIYIALTFIYSFKVHWLQTAAVKRNNIGSHISSGDTSEMVV